MERRVKDVLKAVIMEILDMLPPDQRANAFEEVGAQVRERLSKRDTQRVKVQP